MKPDEAKLLDEKVRKAISAGVQAAVHKTPRKLLIVSSGTPLSRGLIHPHIPFSKGSASAFRNRMRNAKIWEPVREILAEERLKELFRAEIKRRERAAADPRQMLLGFENIPRTIDVQKLSVKDFLVRAARYEKRVNKNRLAADEIVRLADLIRDQPPELSVPEAIARARASEGGQAKSGR